MRGLAFATDEKTLALRLEGKVQVWSTEVWELQDELPVSTKVVSALAYTADERLSAAGGTDKRVRFWSL